MKYLYKSFIMYLLFISINWSTVNAQNPIIQTSYTADPAPMVYNGKVYLYTSHDEDESTWFVMNDWKLYTTEDMVNWTDHGAVLSYSDFSWAKINAWAPQCIQRNDKFYMYVPITTREGHNSIGVAVANTPYGPFIDPLDKPLIRNNSADIDPTVFIDDDSQAYLLWGNPVCYYVKLNEDMISYKGEIKQFPNTIEAFGKRVKDNPIKPTTYEEGPWLYKRNDLYYLLFAGGALPEHIGYSTSKKPTGPWEYRGVVMPTQGGSFTNHPGMIDYKGSTYFFYHNSALPGGSGFNRSVCVENVEFSKDGSIKQMNMTEGIKEGLTTLNPYIKTEAETIAWSNGVKSMENDAVGVFITAMQDDAYTKVKNVDFRKNGSSKFTARLGTTHNGNVSMEIRLDTLNGELLSTIDVPMTGGDDRWALVSTDIEQLTGVHDIFFVFKGSAISNIMYFDYWMFSE